VSRREFLAALLGGLVGGVCEPWCGGTASVRSLEQRVPFVPVRLRRPFCRAVRDHARISRWDEDFWATLAAAVCETESSWKERAVSRSGAVGLMQIHYPYWGPRLGISPEELFDPYFNLRLGMLILEEALRRHRGNTCQALLDYLGARRYSYAAVVLERAFHNAQEMLRLRGPTGETEVPACRVG